MANRLIKLHATGNDFVVQSALRGDRAPARAEVARFICDRHRGIGADGFITMLPGADGADCTMELRNADGSVAEMSGNGIRCLAWVAHRAGLGDGRRLVVDTGSGRRVLDLELDPKTNDVVFATCDMGPVTFEPTAIPVSVASPFDLTAGFHGTEYRGDAAGMGNPHFVLLVDDPATARVTQHGPRLEVDERFPARTNVEFIAPTPGETDAITLRVWERGVGETLSCGTGACAAAAVAHRRGLVDTKVTVHVPGGELAVALGGTIQLGGPVVRVFETVLPRPR